LQLLLFLTGEEDHDVVKPRVVTCLKQHVTELHCKQHCAKGKAATGQIYQLNIYTLENAIAKDGKKLGGVLCFRV